MAYERLERRILNSKYMNRLFTKFFGQTRNKEEAPIIEQAKPEDERVVGETIERVDEKLITMVEQRTGSSLRSEILNMVYRGSYRQFAIPDIYDGLYLHTKGHEKFLYVSPLKLLEALDIKILRLGEDSAPIFLHTSKDVRDEMLKLMTSDRSHYVFAAETWYERFSFPAFWATSSAGVNAICTQLGVREILNWDFSIPTYWQQHGTKNLRVQTRIKRIEPKILAEIGNRFTLDKPKIEDLLVYRGNIDDSMLSRVTGKRVDSDRYDEYNNKLITSYYFRDFTHLVVEQVINPNESGGDLTSLLIPGLLGSDHLLE